MRVFRHPTLADAENIAAVAYQAMRGQQSDALSQARGALPPIPIADLHRLIAEGYSAVSEVNGSIAGFIGIGHFLHSSLIRIGAPIEITSARYVFRVAPLVVDYRYRGIAPALARWSIKALIEAIGYDFSIIGIVTHDRLLNFYQRFGAIVLPGEVDTREGKGKLMWYKPSI